MTRQLNPRLVRVEPIGSHEAPAFWDGQDPATGKDTGGFAIFLRPTLPPNPRGDALREIRVGAHVTLCDAAKALALTVEELSGLEHGRYAFAEPEWESAMVTVLELKKPKPEPADNDPSQVLKNGDKTP